MRILVVSLLRLGDFIQHVPVLEAVAQRYQTKNIDVLTFNGPLGLKPMLTCVQNWWTLDRDELQMGLGRADIPLLTSFDILRERLDQISSMDYDLVINLSQTEFSASIMGYIQAKEKMGLSFGDRGQALFHSPWFRYLDRHAEVISPDVFNYCDIFFQGCGLQGFEKKWPLTATEFGKFEVDNLIQTADVDNMNRPLVVIQAFTSDSKKSWGHKSWVTFLDRLVQRHPEWRIVVLASPPERDAAQQITQATNTELAILSLDGALALLNIADLLVTGDTSIKHLANASKVRVLELSLGPSDFLRTGIYKPDSLILQPQLACTPCAHSAPCTMATHACALALAPEVVACAAEALMNDDWAKLSELARISAPIRFLKTAHLETGFWFAADLTEAESLRAVENLLDRCSWKFYLNQEFKRKIVEFGTEGVHLNNEIKRLFSPGIRQPLLAHLDFLDQELSRKQEQVSNRRDGFLGRNSTLASYDLSYLRQEQNKLEEESRQNEIKVKLIRSLKSRLMESM